MEDALGTIVQNHEWAVKKMGRWGRVKACLDQGAGIIGSRRESGTRPANSDVAPAPLPVSDIPSPPPASPVEKEMTSLVYLWDI